MSRHSIPLGNPIVPTDIQTPRRTAIAQPSGREVFDILVRDHASMLTAFLGSIGPADSVDDLFQETMLVAWRRLADYDRERPFGPWLRGIAARLARKHRGVQAREAARIDSREVELIEAQFAAATDRHGSFEGVFDQLRRCVQRLPETLASAIDLVYRRGLAMADAARRLGASEEAVKKRVQRGRRLVRDCMAEQEASS
jgi:RNA polymerase sigma-70 factor (ECF subfamily)